MHMAACASILIRLKDSSNYKDRLTFLLSCEQFMFCGEKFESQYGSDFVDLAEDKVVNVRIMLSDILHWNRDIVDKSKSLKQAWTIIMTKTGKWIPEIWQIFSTEDWD